MGNAMNFMGFFDVKHKHGTTNRYAIITKNKSQSYNLKRNLSEFDVDFVMKLDAEYGTYYYQFFSAHDSLVNAYCCFPKSAWHREIYVSE